MMEDNNKKVRIRLERHIWPDELMRMEEKRNKRVAILAVIVMMVIVFLLGWTLGGSRIVQTSQQDKAQTKLNVIQDIMSKDWYFAKEDDNISEHLLDRALYGMTTSEVDPHTTYLSSEQLNTFTQSINMNFVGIGVQFIAQDGLNMIEKVFKFSPAEEAGVLAGDIINKVGGTSVEGLTADEIKDLVRGEAGSKVVIEFLRQGTPISIEITRREVHGTAYGQMINENVGYLEIYQFGETTGEEVGGYLQDLTDAGMTKLIIDVRDNGGGYLDALVDIASYFVNQGEIVMKQEYSDGSIKDAYAKAGKFDNIEGIVVLVNENTASAAEVLALSLSDLRDDVTILGVTSYGKGTVQVTQSFYDGSALKYTVSKWLSPNGLSINNKGITPDVVVELHPILDEKYIKLEDGVSYKVDQVSEYVRIAQEGLDFIDYKVDRMDGYFDQSTEVALKLFEKDHNLEVDGILDAPTVEALLSSITKVWSLSKEKDLQYQAAFNLLTQ